MAGWLRGVDGSRRHASSRALHDSCRAPRLRPARHKLAAACAGAAAGAKAFSSSERELEIPFRGCCRCGRGAVGSGLLQRVRGTDGGSRTEARGTVVDARW